MLDFKQLLVDSGSIVHWCSKQRKRVFFQSKEIILMLLPSTQKGPQILFRNKENVLLMFPKDLKPCSKAKYKFWCYCPRHKRDLQFFFHWKSFNIIPGTEGTAGSVTGWDVASADTRWVDNNDPCIISSWSSNQPWKNPNSLHVIHVMYLCDTSLFDHIQKVPPQLLGLTRMKQWSGVLQQMMQTKKPWDMSCHAMQ